jgi:hypothetical protein
MERPIGAYINNIESEILNYLQTLFTSRNLKKIQEFTEIPQIGRVQLLIYLAMKDKEWPCLRNHLTISAN